MLRSRLLTALVGLPVLLLIILFLPMQWFVLLVVLMALLGAWEWTRLIPLESTAVRAGYLAAIAVCVCIPLGVMVWQQSYYVLGFGTLMVMIALPIWVWITIAILRTQQAQQACGLQKPFWRGLFGFIFIASALVYIVVYATMNRVEFFYILCVIFAMDTGGYFFGRKYGRRALASRISPKKTWEGFWGGILVALVVAMLGSWYFWQTMYHPWVLWIVMPLVAGFSVIGDLAVSLVKRQVGVKDSGYILPGHGGLLDRMDSIVAGLFMYDFLALLIFVVKKL